MSKKQKQTNVAFCIPNMIIGGVESVLVTTVDNMLNNPNIKVSIITHQQITEPKYANWLKSHPEIPVYVCFPFQIFFEKLAKYCRFFPLKQLRKIIFSLYKKYRRFVIRRKLKDQDVFIDYKNFEFFKELRHFNQPKIGWIHGAFDYFEQHICFSRLPLYTKVVGLSDEFITEFKQKYPQHDKKLVRIYNPIDVSEIQQKARNGETPLGKYFCHVSRLAAGKDIKTLMDAFEIFSQKHQNVKLYIVGGGDQETEFRQYAARLKCGANIVFTGALNNPYPIMRGAIANILSSETEGFGMVLVESMALGVPCISSNCKSGPKEILLEERGGLLFNIGDAKMLADKMCYIYENPDAAAQMTRTATDGLKRFAPKTITKQIIDTILGVL